MPPIFVSGKMDMGLDRSRVMMPPIIRRGKMKIS